MSPRVEAAETNNEHINHFVVNLQNIDPFDVVLFEELAKKVDYRPEQEFSRLKFIVINGKMWIFSERQFHFGFYTKLKNPEKEGIIQSAGSIDISYDVPDIQYSPFARRKLFGWSSTLALELPRKTSDEYKLEELTKKLGAFFRIQ